MTTYYVSPTGNNSNDGLSTSTPWATFTKAANTSANGDTIKLMPGTYNEQLVITKNNQTWTTQGAAHTAIIDGKYGPGPNSSYLTINIAANGESYSMEHPRVNRGKWLPALAAVPGYITAGLVTLGRGATGNTISNLYVRRSAGSCIYVGPTNHNTTIDNCKLDFSYAGSICGGGQRGAKLTGFTVTNCVITRSSMRKLTGKARTCEGHRGDGLGCPGNGHIIDPATGKPYPPTGGKDSVDVTIKPKYTDGATISGNTIAFSYGEGIAAAAGSSNVVIANNLIHNTYHWSIGVNCSQNVEVYGNKIFSINTLPVIKTASSGINIGDEIGEYWKTGNDYATRKRSKNIKIYNNLVIGTTRCFDIRAGDYVTRLENAYVGYNTWIGRPYDPNTQQGTVEVIKLTTGAEPGATENADVIPANHYSFLYENNIHIKNGARYQQNNPPASLGPGVVVRNNAYDSQPTGILYNPSNSIYTGIGGDDIAAGVPQHDSPLYVFYDVRMEDCDPTAHTFSANHYHLVEDADCRGAASNGSAAAGVTPTVTTDYLGNTRDGDPDIGWHEYGAAGGGGGVTIGFTQKESPGGAAVDGGAAPYAVYFDDTSTTYGGATITTRRWDFGDGNSILAPDGAEFLHTYAAPGTYQARLTVWDNNARSYTKLGAAFVVTGDDGGTGAVKVVSISQAIGTGAAGTTVDFDFGGSLGGYTPKLVIFTVTNATATGTATAHATLGHGFAADNGKQWAAAMCSKDNVTDTLTGRQHRNDACILTVDETGATTGAAKFRAVSANMMTVEIVDVFPASYLVTATAYAGDGVLAKVGDATGPISGQSVALDTPFRPHIIGVVTTNAGGLATPLTTGAISIGYATSPANQYCVRWHESHGKTQGTPRLDLQNALAFRNTAASNFLLKLSGVAANGATLTPEGGDYDVPFGWFALNLATDYDLRVVSTPVATGNQDTTLGWEPGHLQGIVTLGNANTGSWTSSLAGPLGVYVATGAFERTNTITSQYSTAAGDSTNTQSLIVASGLGVPLHTGGATADGLAGDGSFIATGYRINWTTVQASTRRVVMLAVATSAGAAPAGPLVSFSVTPLSGDAPLDVELTDTSDGNGDAIDAWEIDWGDDSDPELTGTRPNALPHTYDNVGLYDVTVSATNGNGTTTLTKTGYVSAGGAPPAQIIGPILADTITEESENQTDLDPDSNRRGLQTHKIDFGALRISSDYTNGGERELVEVPGKWQFAIIDGQLHVMDDAGNTGTIAINWDDGAPPPADGGTEHLQISSGNQDGHELNDGSVTVTATYIQQDAGTQEAALRFGPVNIPQGATITSALLSVYVLSTYDDPDSRIYAEDVNNATVLDTTTNFIQTTLLGAKTTAYTDWTATNIGTGWKTSPELKTVVQEVISRAGWASGNYLNLLFDANGAGSNLRFYSHDYGDHTYGAKLDITWSA